MKWKQLLAAIAGSVDEEFRLRNAYLVVENRILRNQIRGRVQLTDAERRTIKSLAGGLPASAGRGKQGLAKGQCLVGVERQFLLALKATFSPCRGYK